MEGFCTCSGRKDRPAWCKKNNPRMVPIVDCLWGHGNSEERCPHFGAADIENEEKRLFDEAYKLLEQAWDDDKQKYNKKVKEVIANIKALKKLQDYEKTTN